MKKKKKKNTMYNNVYFLLNLLDLYNYVPQILDYSHLRPLIYGEKNGLNGGKMRNLADFRMKDKKETKDYKMGFPGGGLSSVA